MQSKENLLKGWILNLIGNLSDLQLLSMRNNYFQVSFISKLGHVKCHQILELSSYHMLGLCCYNSGLQFLGGTDFC